MKRSLFVAVAMFLVALTLVISGCDLFGSASYVADYLVAFPDGTVIGYTWNGSGWDQEVLDSIPASSDIHRAGVSIEQVTMDVISDGSPSSGDTTVELLSRNIGPAKIGHMEFVVKVNKSDGSHTFVDLDYFDQIEKGQLNLETENSYEHGPIDSIEFLQLDLSWFDNAGDYFHTPVVLDLTGYFTLLP